mgnify:CR=1 FL=1
MSSIVHVNPEAFAPMVADLLAGGARYRMLLGTDDRAIGGDGLAVEAALSEHMLFIRNNDQPGLIGGVGTILGDAKQNIADFRLGRKEDTKEAVCLISLDAPVSDDLLAKISKLPQIQNVKRLRF